ncbi:MAG TPA: ABC transporter ATP-binding protein [Phycisphaeraceae bacterium]
MRVPRYSAWAIYRRLLEHARPYWPHIAGVCFLNLLAIPLKLLTPLPLKIAVDNAIGGEPLPGPLASLDTSQSLLLAAALVVGVALAALLNGLGIWLLHSYTGQKLVLGFRALLFHHVQRLSLGYHDTRGTTDSTYRIQYDAPAIQWIAIDGVIPFLGAVLTVAGMIGVIAAMDLTLAALALLIAPVLLALTHRWSRQLRDQWRHAKALESAAMGVVQETLGSLRLVKAFGQEQREQQRFVDHATREMRSQLRVAASQGTFDLLIGLTLAAGSALMLWVGVRHVQAGVLKLGELLMIWAYLAQFYGPLQMISSKITTLQGSMASAERAFALLDEVPEVQDKPDARPLERCQGRVRFESVGFAYRPNQPVLHRESFEVEPGMRVGVAGHTGAGKSTLMNLLTRFYDPSEGRILLDEVDLRDYRLDDLRKQFAIVLQEPVLFSSSIAENIAYARPEASMAQIIAAAKAANAHEFIAALPQGYDTMAGERGMMLSGGQRQRISLARAFLKDAPILILDEPTSAVDVHTEEAILEATQRLMRNRTTFMIAHRLSTLRGCDLLLVLENGRLVQARRDVEAALIELSAKRPAALEGVHS